MEEHLPSSLAPAEAGQTVSRPPARTAGADGAGERADEPRIDGDALTCGGDLDRGLQALGEPQRDPGGQRVLGGRGRRCRVPFVLDVDERRVLARKPDLDVAV